MIALTLGLQLLQAALNLSFGLLALRVVAAERGEPARVEGWRIVAAAFVVMGAHGLPHSLWAVWAVAAGAESAPYRAYLATLSEANLMRGFVTLGSAAYLAWRVWVPRPPLRSWRPLAVLLGAMLALGAVAGMLEGEYSNAVHFTALNAVEVVTVVVLFATLVRAMPSAGVDYLLWLALAAYGLRQVFNVLLMSVMAWIGTGLAWTPHPVSYPAVGVLSLAVMNLAAWRRVRVSGRPGRARPLLDVLIPLRSSAPR